MPAHAFAPDQRVLVVPRPPADRRNYVATCWLGIVVRFMARGKLRGMYEVAPVGGGPTRFVAREEIEPAETDAMEGDGA